VKINFSVQQQKKTKQTETNKQKTTTESWCLKLCNVPNIRKHFVHRTEEIAKSHLVKYAIHCMTITEGCWDTENSFKKNKTKQTKTLKARAR
jgi:hypothetical protein